MCICVCMYFSIKCDDGGRSERGEFRGNGGWREYSIKIEYCDGDRKS